MLLIWVALYIWRKDTRKEMWFISIIFTFAGFSELVFVRDWWRPLTITNTIPGIESFLFSFAFAGIVAVIYEDVFRKRLRIKKTTRKIEKKRNLKLFLIFLVLVILFLVGTYLIGLNTLQATLLALIPGILIIWYQRKDLVKDSLFTAILSLIIMVPVFIFVELITPGVVQEFWLFENVPNLVLLWVPIDDLIFYMIAGAFIGPLYEYWQEGRLINKK